MRVKEVLFELLDEVQAVRLRGGRNRGLGIIVHLHCWQCRTLASVGDGGDGGGGAGAHVAAPAEKEEEEEEVEVEEEDEAVKAAGKTDHGP